MLSSSEVSAMFAAQNQMFMGQGQYAQQVGIQTPNLGLASWGTSRQAAFGPQGTFGGHAPVSYGSSGMAGPGYGAGSRIAGGAMSALGGIGSAASMLAFDPFTAFLKGGGFMGMGGGVSGGIGGLVGGGLAGGALAAGATMLPMMAAQKAIGSFVGGGQQQQAIQSSLGGFNFLNQGSRSGQGFSRDDAQMIGQQVRAIAHIPEMMTSVEELTRLIPRLKASGAMAGVRDAAEFNSRFKEAVKTLRDVSKVMGTTMEEASQFFEHSRSVGYLGRKDQLKNAMNVQFTAAQTGMSTQQVMQMQQGGAQMAVGMGIRRRTGVETVTNLAQNIGAGLQAGNISQGDIEDLTGVTGEGATAAAAQQIAQKLARFAEGSSAGRLSMMALSDFDPRTGKLIGINTKLAQRYARGEVDKEELQARLQNLTHDQKIAASRKTATMAMQFAGATGVGGASAFMGNVLEQAGYRSEEAKMYQMQKYGMTETEVEFMSQMQGVVGGGDSDRKKKQLERRRRMEAEISERTDPSKIMSRVGTKLKSGLGITAAEEAGAKMFSFIGSAFDEFVDDVVGRYSVKLSEEGARKLSDSFRSGQGRKQLADIFGKAMGAPKFTQAGQAHSLSKMLGFAMNPMSILGGAAGINAAGLGVEGGLKGISEMFSNAGRTEIGDDPERRRAFLQKQFGMAGADSGAMSKRFQELRGMGAGSTAAQSQMRDLISKLNETGAFREANTEDRIRMIQEELGGEGPSAAKMMMAPGLALGELAMQKYQESKYGDIVAEMKKQGISKAEAAVAYGAGRIKDPNFSEASLRDRVRNSAKDIKAAQAHLKDVFGEDAAAELNAMLTADNKLGEHMQTLMSGGPEGQQMKAVLEDMDISIEEGAKKLGMSEKEFSNLRKAGDRVAAYARQGDPKERSERVAKAQAALTGVWGANTRKDFDQMFQAVEEMAGEMGQGTDLRKALERLTLATDQESYGAAQEGVQKTLAQYAERMMSGNEGMAAVMKDVGGPESRMGGYLMRMTKGGKGEKAQGKVTKEQLAKRLNVDVSELDTFMEKEFEGGKTVDVTAEIATKAKAHAISGGAVGVALDQADKAKRDPAKQAEKLNTTLGNIDNTLKDVEKTVKLNTTTIALLSSQQKTTFFGNKTDETKALESEKAKLEGKPDPHAPN